MVPFNLLAMAILSEILSGEEKASLAAPNVLPFIPSMQKALGTMLRFLCPLSIAKKKTEGLQRTELFIDLLCSFVVSLSEKVI